MTKAPCQTLTWFSVLGLVLAWAPAAAWAEAPRSRPILNACAGKPEPGYWIQRLTAPDPRTRSLAASALGEMRAKTAIPALIRALGDRDPRVRGAVVEALGRIGPDAKAAIPVVRGALSDEDPAVREKAHRALKWMGTE